MMKICIDNSDTKNFNDETHRNSYTALCQEHQHYYGAYSNTERLDNYWFLKFHKFKKKYNLNHIFSYRGLFMD